MLFFRTLCKENENCVAAIGALHFSVRGFGCALFYFERKRKMEENKNLQAFEAELNQEIAENNDSASTPPVKPTKKKSKAKIVVFIILGLIVIAGLVIGGIILFGHKHEFADATCTLPKTCECGTTEGEPNGHSWKDASCTNPKTCRICNATEGEPKGHDWKSATCTAPKTCKTCSKTEGNKTSHSVSIGICSYCNGAQGWDTVKEIGDYVTKASEYLNKATTQMSDFSSVYSAYADILIAESYIEYCQIYLKEAYYLCDDYSALNNLKSKLSDVAFYSFPDVDVKLNSIKNWVNYYDDYTKDFLDAFDELMVIVEKYK